MKFLSRLDEKIRFSFMLNQNRKKLPDFLKRKTIGGNRIFL